MNRISLTSSMRSNLLSLQNISRQVSSTQNKLATGNKVNSAIDNPSSYYTARSLNNRADDLNALLDSMGQAVSTIKAATTALEAGADFLEQAAAVATGALETAAVPAKSYFADKGTVVTTAQELKDAVNAGKETIIVYGKIDYFENETLTLKAGQKLVGTEYFTGYTGKAKFSQLNITSGLTLQQDGLISDLAISSKQNGGYAISALKNTFIHNLDLEYQTNASSYSAGILVQGAWELNLSGQININTSVPNGCGIYLFNGGTLNSNANVSVSQINMSQAQARLNILGGSFYAETMQIGSGVLNVSASGSLTAKNELFLNNAEANISGRLNILSPTNQGLYLTGTSSLTAASTAEISVKGTSYFLNLASSSSTAQFAAGCRLNLYLHENINYLIAKADYNGQGKQAIRAQTLLDSGNFAETAEAEPIDWNNWPPTPLPPESVKEEFSAEQYISVLSQYDNLIKDGSYKGINLLQKDKLNVKFNESGSAALEVRGKDMSSAALGLQTIAWQTQDDIAQSLAEISAALKSIRSFSAELGNNYSIITSRQDFTENLINILTEGADKLTLADMNEESANILALQTRQQLAINSLSLASQASQAVLKLF